MVSSKWCPLHGVHYKVSTTECPLHDVHYMVSMQAASMLFSRFKAKQAFPKACIRKTSNIEQVFMAKDFYTLRWSCIVCWHPKGVTMQLIQSTHSASNLGKDNLAECIITTTRIAHLLFCWKTPYDPESVKAHDS